MKAGERNLLGVRRVVLERGLVEYAVDILVEVGPVVGADDGLVGSVLDGLTRWARHGCNLPLVVGRRVRSYCSCWGAHNVVVGAAAGGPTLFELKLNVVLIVGVEMPRNRTAARARAQNESTSERGEGPDGNIRGCGVTIVIRHCGCPARRGRARRGGAGTNARAVVYESVEGVD